VTEPILQVVKGDPTPEELAALIMVVAARSAATPAPAPERANNWATYWRNARTPLRPGPGRWRASAHP
jgi:hypothetical protein